MYRPYGNSLSPVLHWSLLEISEMEMQDRTETEEESVIEENSEETSSNNRLYNGFQGSLTEPGDNKAMPDVDTSSSSRGTLLKRPSYFLQTGHLVLLLLIFLTSP